MATRMSYNDVFETVRDYAPEMLHVFADKFERFPAGGNAAMIANYLNDHADFWRKLGLDDVAEKMVNAAGEIIVRCG